MKGHHQHHHTPKGHGHEMHMHVHHKKKGGRIGMKVSGNPDVFEEADEKKHGGKVKKKHGGKVVGLMTGGAVKPRLDRPGRKMGGRVGADKAPLSSAHKSSSAEKNPVSQEGGMSD